MMSPFFNKADGAADGGFGADVADACAACAAAESAVGYEGDGFAEACTHDIACGAKHFLHTGAAFGAFVADDDDIARLDLAGEDAVAGFFLTFKDDGRAGVREHCLCDARGFDDRAVGGEVAF